MSSIESVSLSSTHTWLAPVHESERPLREHVRCAVNQYFVKLEDAEPTNMYDLILSQVLKPVLEIVLQRCNNNKSRAAKILGVSRTTLLKLLQRYQIPCT